MDIPSHNDIHSYNDIHTDNIEDNEIILSYNNELLNMGIILFFYTLGDLKYDILEEKIKKFKII